MAISVKGKTVVLTGTLTDMERSEAEAKLKKKGAKCTGSVSKNTDMLFAGADAGSKLFTAKSLDIPVYGEKELFAIIGKPKPKPKKAAKKPTKAAKKKVAAAKAAPSGPGFKGKTVVVTGTLSKGRAVIEATLKKAGARVTGSVSANTNFLIVGTDAGSKLDTAQSLGVTILNEAQMNAMLAGKPVDVAAAADGGDEEE